MERYNRELQHLADQLQRHRHLQTVIEQLRQQRTVLTEEADLLKEQAYREELDVERLERLSLNRMFLRLTGRLEEAISKEEAESCAAALKYDAKRRQLKSIETQLQEAQQELNTLVGCQKKYDALLAEKQQALKTMNSYYADRICPMEAALAQLTAQERELREAVSAADAALRSADRVLDALSSAGNWSTVDILGGGIISDMAKHSHLDRAQQELNALQQTLSRLRRELADVDIYAEMQVQVDGFLRFADYFFDGLITDWAVKDRISRSKQQILNTKDTVRAVKTQLEDRLNRCRRQLREQQSELDDLVRKA